MAQLHRGMTVQSDGDISYAHCVECGWWSEAMSHDKALVIAGDRCPGTEHPPEPTVTTTRTMPMMPHEVVR